MALKALLFDVDGTLAETEELHRACFNEVFANAGYDWNWPPDLYRDLLKVTGGKERIHHYLDRADVDLGADAAVKIAAFVRGGGSGLVFGSREWRGRHGLALAIATTTSRSNLDALLAASRACFIKRLIPGRSATSEPVRRA